MSKARMLAAILIVASLVLGTVWTAFAERQPRMESALNHLREARSELEKASKDKGGHREEAIKFVEKAIDEVQKGINFDNKH